MQIAHRFNRWTGWLVIVALLSGLWLSFGPLYKAYIRSLGWVYYQVRSFHQVLTDSVGALADDTSLVTSFALIASSFIYGVLHAAGPGHGKVILSTYLLSQPEKIKKSLVLATLSALTQGLVAVILVYGLFYLFGLVSRDTKIAVAWSERLAFILVAIIGLALLWRGLKAALAAHSTFAADKEITISHDHDHDHHHHHHAAGHDGVCTTCGHAHLPSNSQVEAATDWRTTLGVILSIGLRPCTGAVLVLIFARYSGVSWAGMLAVLAMSLGTALTVSALAITSVGARDLALRLLGASTGWSERLGAYVAIIGGVVLTLMGIGLLTSSFAPPIRSMGL